MSRSPGELDCPSGQPDMPNARIFGVLGGSEEEPRVAYLKPGVKVSEQLLGKLGAMAPTRIFRFAATCEKSACSHFDGSRCQLGRRVAEQLEPVVDELPPCQIRSSCRWFSEQGRAVCFRCPQVTTCVTSSDPLSQIAATPEAKQVEERRDSAAS